jgi:hypothetical protein
MTRQQFIRHAEGQPVVLRGMPLSVVPKLYPTGSCGWSTSGTLTVKVGDEHVKVLFSVRLTAVGSKRWEKGT